MGASINGLVPTTTGTFNEDSSSIPVVGTIYWPKKWNSSRFPNADFSAMIKINKRFRAKKGVSIVLIIKCFFLNLYNLGVLYPYANKIY